MVMASAAEMMVALLNHGEPHNTHTHTHTRNTALLLCKVRASLDVPSSRAGVEVVLRMHRCMARQNTADDQTLTSASECSLEASSPGMERAGLGGWSITCWSEQTYHSFHGRGGLYALPRLAI